MKKTKIIFWVTTIIIFLFEGVMPAFTSQSEMSVSAITGLGYPLYFITMLTIFKVLGSLALIIKQVPSKIKEWAYAGFAIDFIAAFVSIWVVMGFGVELLMPLVFMVILVLSYISYHKMNGNKLCFSFCVCKCNCDTKNCNKNNKCNTCKNCNEEKPDKKLAM